MKLEALFLHTPSDLSRSSRTVLHDSIVSEFPELPVIILCGDSRRDSVGEAVRVSAEEWCSGDFEPVDLDSRVNERVANGPVALALLGGLRQTPTELALAAGQLLTRYQRLLRRRNRWSATPEFERILEMHRGLHDLSKPLVAADFDHALDTWQWVLRLEPRASCALQLAALFHDVERLISEPERRTEHQATDYGAYKRLHAEAGADVAREMLTELGIRSELVGHAEALIRAHEQPGPDPELQVLNDADALSFFSLNACGFARYYGPEHTSRKIVFTLGRMRPAARARLSGIRHCAHLNERLATLLATLGSGGDRQPDCSSNATGVS